MFIPVLACPLLREPVVYMPSLPTASTTWRPFVCKPVHTQAIVSRGAVAVRGFCRWSGSRKERDKRFLRLTCPLKRCRVLRPRLRRATAREGGRGVGGIPLAPVHRSALTAVTCHCHASTGMERHKRCLQQKQLRQASSLGRGHSRQVSWRNLSNLRLRVRKPTRLSRHSRSLCRLGPHQPFSVRLAFALGIATKPVSHPSCTAPCPTKSNPSSNSMHAHGKAAMWGRAHAILQLSSCGWFAFTRHGMGEFRQCSRLMSTSMNTSFLRCLPCSVSTTRPHESRKRTQKTWNKKW